MGSAEHKKFEALLERYLDPTERWSVGDEASLRTQVRESEECAGAYDRAVSVHRLMVGADPMIPSGHERQRMMASVLDVIEAAEASRETAWSRLLVWLRPAALIGAAVACLLVVVSTDTIERVIPSEELYVGSRGMHFDLNVGIGVSGVTEDSAEYEAIAGESALHIDDYMRLYTTRAIDKFPYLFVFGLQDGWPIWYAPDPESSESASIEIERGRSIPLGGSTDGFEIKLSGRHKVGPLTVVAMFTDDPLNLGKVADVLAQRPEYVPLNVWLEA